MGRKDRELDPVENMASPKHADSEESLGSPVRLAPAVRPELLREEVNSKPPKKKTKVRTPRLENLRPHCQRPMTGRVTPGC